MIILIADDDRLIRFTIKSMLSDILGDAGDVFYEAANGSDMVKICREQKPDIAFVDIKMPRMDGLDSIEESRKYSDTTEYVIISGYSEFEYAKRGISLGVNEYLLKPVDEEQLADVVCKLKEKLKNRKKESNSMFQLHVMNMLNFYSVTEEVQYDEELDEKVETYLTFVLYVRTNMKNKDQSAQIQRELFRSVRTLGDQVVLRGGHYAVSPTDEGFPCAVFGIDRQLKTYVIEHVRKIIASEEYGEKSFCYVLWFETDTLEKVCETCSRLDSQIYTGIQYPSGNVYQFDEKKIDERSRRFLYYVDQIMAAWENADGIICKEVMNKIWREYKDKEPQIDLKNVSRYCSFITGCEMKEDSLKSFCTSIVEQSDRMYKNVVREEKDMITQVKAYIQKYYMNDISISQIAEHFGLTANYLSTLFHQKAGMKFINYLTETRVNAAKKLLVQNASASVQDIALMVGYNSTRHFSSLFQKQTGMTPSAYRKMQL